jgi:hypothetical protein
MPYVPRLLCLCLAAYFVIHCTVGVLVSVLGEAAVRAARRMRPRSAGRFLLTLRLLPSVLALAVVAGLCVPSYLWLEPESGLEEVGAGCLAAAILAAAMWTVSIARGARAALRSARHTRESGSVSRRSNLPGSHLPVWIVDAPAPLVALVGVFAPRLLISRAVSSALPAAQLAAALRHEEAHHDSRDNLKRLLILLTPGLFPGLHGFGPIERGWARFTEWAADDDAVGDDAHQSLSLAAALVRVARMGAAPPVSPLCTSFLGDGSEIGARVDRLLSPRPAPPVRRRYAAAVAGAALATGCAAGMLHPATLASAHCILELLIH